MSLFTFEYVNDSHVGGGVGIPTRCQLYILPNYTIKYNHISPTYIITHNYILPNYIIKYNHISPIYIITHNYTLPNYVIKYNHISPIYIITHNHMLPNYITQHTHIPSNYINIHDHILPIYKHTRPNSLNIGVFVNPLVSFIMYNNS